MAEDDRPLSLGAVPCPPGGTLHISWGLGNELYVCGTSQAADQESHASCVQWGCLPASQRRIAYDSSGKYEVLAARSLERDPRSPEAWADASEYGHTISAVLAADGARAAEPSDDELFNLQERALWELLALFFLEAGRPQSLASQDLARWLRRNAVAVAGPGGVPLPAQLLRELQDSALPEGHSGYWPCLARLVALGWASEAVELVGLHSAWLRWDGSGTDPATSAQVSALEAATLLMRRFPTLQQSGAAGPGAAGGASSGREFATPAELLAFHRTWQAQIRAVLGDAELWAACQEAGPETAEGLRSVLEVAAGQEAALVAAAESWPELLVGQLLHAHPGARPQAELRQLLRSCYAAAAGGPASAFLDAAAAVLEGCCEAEPQSVMRACSSFCSDWFLAHAPALMAPHPAGAPVLGAELAHLGGSQVEFYSLEYAAALMPHAPTWQLAAAYLAWCPAHGRAALEALLRRLPLDAGDPGRALRGAAVAERQGLVAAAEGLARRQGVMCWQAGLLGAALTWFARCDDGRRTDVALAPLAAAVSRGGAAAARAALVVTALAPQLEGLPAGSSNAALLQVHRLLSAGAEGGGGGLAALHAAVEALARLPPSMRDDCLHLVCNAVPALPPGSLAEHEVLRLLGWLQSAEERLPSSKASASEKQTLGQGIAVTRLALARAVAAAHMVGTAGA